MSFFHHLIILFLTIGLFPASIPMYVYAAGSTKPANEQPLEQDTDSKSKHKTEKCFRVCSDFGKVCSINQRNGRRECRRECKSFKEECFEIENSGKEPSETN